MKRIMLTGTSSGCGKTTLTCALLSALKAKGREVVSFKCGPDYIDPMFHREITGVNSYNLDPFFLEHDALRAAIGRRRGDIAVIEGAMGYYDGIACTENGSAYEVAGATSTPVILVVNARNSGNSIGAVISGFKSYRSDSGIEGVIFNGVSKSRYEDLRELAADAGLRPLGYLPFEKSMSIESRNLGLVTPAEIGSLKAKIMHLGELALKCLDIDAIEEIASASSLGADAVNIPSPDKKAVAAVAKDEAFSFIYQENIEALEDAGFTVRYFSPIHDKELPTDADALYLCGGYPELYSEKLSGNKTMLQSLRFAINGGMPTIAECGGFMYLHEHLAGYPMVGILPGSTVKTPKLQRFGYQTLTAKADNLLCEKGEEIRVHEFHYWDSSNVGGDFSAKKAGRDLTYECAHGTDSLYAGFPHLYFPGKPEITERLLNKALEYQEKRA